MAEPKRRKVEINGKVGTEDVLCYDSHQTNPDMLVSNGSATDPVGSVCVSVCNGKGDQLHQVNFVLTDVFIMSDDKCWTEDVLSYLKKNRPNLKCTSQKDWICGRWPTDNLINSAERSKLVVIGFPVNPKTDYSKYAAHIVAEGMLEAKKLDNARLILVKLAENAEIPSCFLPLTAANTSDATFRPALLERVDECDAKNTPFEGNVKAIIVRGLRKHEMKEELVAEFSKDWSLNIEEDCDSTVVSNENVFDICIVSCDNEWETKVCKKLRKERSGRSKLNVISRHEFFSTFDHPRTQMSDAIAMEKFLEYVYTSKKVVVGFGTKNNGYPNKIAALVTNKLCAENRDFEQLIPVKLSTDAILANTVKYRTPLDGSLDGDVVENILKTLDEQHLKLKVSSKNRNSENFATIEDKLKEYVEDFRDRVNPLLKKIKDYFSEKGLTLNGITIGCILLHLSAPDAKTLQCLLDIDMRRELLEALANFLLPQSLHVEFTQEWSMNIYNEEKVEKDLEIPAEILGREPDALKVFKAAQEEGDQDFDLSRHKEMGNERAGTTSLMDSFLGNNFNEMHDVTDAIATTSNCRHDRSEQNTLEEVEKDLEIPAEILGRESDALKVFKAAQEEGDQDFGLSVHNMEMDNWEIDSFLGNNFNEIHDVTDAIATTRNCSLDRSEQNTSEEDISYDFNIISDNIEWENQVLEGLQKKKPGVRCLSRKDYLPGKYKLENLVESPKKCKKVVVGFTSQPETGKPEYVAAAAVLQMLNDNTLDQGKVLPVRITPDAVIPTWLEPVEVANGWEEGFYDKLLKALSEQEMEESKRGLGNGEDETDCSMPEIPADKLQHENGKYVWKQDGEDDLEVDISSPILEDNVTQLKALKHENVEMFQCLTRMPPDSRLVGVYTSQNRTLKDSKFADIIKKQKAVIDVTHGLNFLHERGIKHGNLNTSTVVVNREGHAMIRDFNFTTVPDSSDLKAKLMFLAPDIEGLATVFWHILSEGKEIMLKNGNKRKNYKIPNYKECKTTHFFTACLDDNLEKRPPVLEVWYWLYGLFDLLLPNTGNYQPSSFRLKKKNPKTLRCKSCPQKKRVIKEELAVAHKETYQHHETDVHYCAHIKCIRKKFPSFEGRISYDLNSNPVISIEDVVTLSDRGCIYHDEASTGFRTYTVSVPRHMNTAVSSYCK